MSESANYQQFRTYGKLVRWATEKKKIDKRRKQFARCLAELSLGQSRFPRPKRGPRLNLSEIRAKREEILAGFLVYRRRRRRRCLREEAPSKTQFCSKSHPLSMRRSPASGRKILCAVCGGEQHPKMPVFSCVQCTFDVCPECYFGKKMIAIRRGDTRRGGEDRDRRRAPDVKIPKRLYKFASKALRSARLRSLLIDNHTNERVIRCVDEKCHVKIRGCVGCHIELFGRCAKLSVVDCDRCTITTPANRPLVVQSEFHLTASSTMSIDLRPSDSMVAVFLVDATERSSFRFNDKMRDKARVYSSASHANAISFGSGALHCIRTQRPHEVQEYLVTFLKRTTGELTTERGVRVGLLVLPVSETM